MARYTGAKCKLCRREGEKLFLKGDRCYTDKCAFERRSYPPGEHGKMRRKPTEYSIQLREKQKVRRMYGLLEGQFRHYFKVADSKKGVTGTNLLMFTDYKGYDPEVNATGRNAIGTRVDITPYPTTRKVLFTVQIDI